MNDLLNEAHDFFTMNMMMDYTDLDFNDVRKSFTKQTSDVFKDVKRLSKQDYFTHDELMEVEFLFDEGGDFIAKNIALNEENIKYVRKIENSLLKSKGNKILIDKINNMLDKKDVFKQILDGELW